MRLQYHGENKVLVTSSQQKARKLASLGFFILNKQLRRRTTPFLKTLPFVFKVISYNRITNARKKDLLMKRFFIYNTLYHIKRKQRRYKVRTAYKDVHFFFRRFSCYKNSQGLVSIFKLVFFIASKKKKTFDLVNNLFMSDKALSGYLVKSYSQENSEDDSGKKTFFFNFSKKKLNAYKVARETH